MDICKTTKAFSFTELHFKQENKGRWWCYNMFPRHLDLYVTRSHNVGHMAFTPRIPLYSLNLFYDF